MDYKEAWKVRKRQIIIANISWGILGIWVITDYQGIETIIAGVLMWLIGAWITETLLSGLGKHDGSTTSSLLDNSCEICMVVCCISIYYCFVFCKE